MADDVSRSSVQYWLENAAQGYLLGREYGHLAGQSEPAWLLASPPLRARAIRVTAQLVAAERCSLAVSSGLVRIAPDEDARRFLATQVIDEARHVEVFTQRLLDLGVDRMHVDESVAAETSPSLASFLDALLEALDRRDFFASIVGHNVLLEGATVAIFELVHAAQVERNPKFAHTLAGGLSDERRHARFGESHVTTHLRREPALRGRAERVQRDLTHWLLAAFADVVREAPVDVPVRVQRGSRRKAAVRPSPVPDDALLAIRLEEEIRMRLARIGLRYLEPLRS